MKSPTLSLLVVRVADPKKSATLFETLGLQFEIERHGSGPEHYSSNLSGVVLELYPATKMNPVTKLRFGFTVCSLENAFENWINAGGNVISDPMHTDFGYRAVLEDFDGNKIEISQATEAH